jgi:multicomponent Na+:H+ antiporter subunit A
LSLNSRSGLEIYFSLLITHPIALIVWSLGLTVLGAQFPSLSYRKLQGMGRRMPIVFGAIVLAHLSMAGFPTLAGFPPQLSLWGELARQGPWLPMIALLGNVGLLIGAFRTLAISVMSKEGQIEDAPSLTPGAQVLFGLGGMIILLSGLLPGWYAPWTASLARAFPNLIVP